MFARVPSLNYVYKRSVKVITLPCSRSLPLQLQTTTLKPRKVQNPEADTYRWRWSSQHDWDVTASVNEEQAYFAASALADARTRLRSAVSSRPAPHQRRIRQLDESIRLPPASAKRLRGGNDHATAHEEDIIHLDGVICVVFTIGGGDVRKVWKDVTDKKLCGKSALNPPRVV